MTNSMFLSNVNFNTHTDPDLVNLEAYYISNTKSFCFIRHSNQYERLFAYLDLSMSERNAASTGDFHKKKVYLKLTFFEDHCISAANYIKKKLCLLCLI